MDEPMPAGAVVRVSRGTFDASRHDDVVAMTRDTGEYLRPAISRLDGLIAYYAAVTATAIAHVSVWRSDADARQMASLKEMIVDARHAAEEVGVVFTPIDNFPVLWSLP
jgi:hypothetical protein